MEVNEQKQTEKKERQQKNEREKGREKGCRQMQNCEREILVAVMID